MLKEFGVLSALPALSSLEQPDKWTKFGDTVTDIAGAVADAVGDYAQPHLRQAGDYFNRKRRDMKIRRAARAGKTPFARPAQFGSVDAMIAQSCGALAADISRSMQEKSVTPESAVVLVVRSRDNVAHCMTPVWIAEALRPGYGGVALCEDRPVSSNAPGSEAIHEVTGDMARERGLVCRSVDLPQLYYAYHKPPFYSYTPLPEEMQRTMRGADPLAKVMWNNPSLSCMSPGIYHGFEEQVGYYHPAMLLKRGLYMMHGVQTLQDETRAPVVFSIGAEHLKPTGDDRRPSMLEMLLTRKDVFVVTQSQEGGTLVTGGTGEAFDLQMALLDAELSSLQMGRVRGYCNLKCSRFAINGRTIEQRNAQTGVYKSTVLNVQHNLN